MGHPVYFNVYALKRPQLLILGFGFRGPLEYFGLAFLFISINSVKHIVCYSPTHVFALVCIGR